MAPARRPLTVAKAYRLLHAIMATAADDELIRRDPCGIDGAGEEDSPEREVISLPDVYAIADKLPARYRALVLLATRGALRSEPPKSRAGKRSLSFPAEIVPELREHLRLYAAPGRKGLIFIGPQGGMLRRNNFNVIWNKATAAAGVFRGSTSTTSGTLEARSPRPLARLPRNL